MIKALKTKSHDMKQRSFEVAQESSWIPNDNRVCDVFPLSQDCLNHKLLLCPLRKINGSVLASL